MTVKAPPSPETILIADDDAAFAMLLADLLAAAGHPSEIVSDAAGAIAALERFPYPLLIADIGMPGNDNLELVHQLATMPQRPRIILVTGNPTVGTATKAVGLPISAYLTKPPERHQLLQLVADALADGRASRALNESHRRVQNWADDIGKVQQLIERSPASESNRYFQAYLGLTLSNLVTALADVGRMVEVIDPASSHQRRETAALVTALQETIGVLEKTRRNFHSKDLASLRKKLEQLLADT